MNNIVLDFSANQQFNNLLANQPLAVMPADLAIFEKMDIMA
jgi:hypothetical protein